MTLDPPDPSLPPPHPGPPGRGVVHVWRIGLDPPDDRLARFAATLSDDETRRAERFRAGELRRRYVAGRGALRAVLAGYLGVEPGRVVFDYGGHGKPALVGPGPAFNLTHTEDLALCAVAAEGVELGVDVERVRPFEDPGRIVGRFFGKGEVAEYLALGESERPPAFWRGWTRKEAFLKATGKGLPGGLDSFEVSLGPDDPKLLHVGHDPAAARGWTVRDVDAGPGFAAAVVASGPVDRVVVFDGPPG